MLIPALENNNEDSYRETLTGEVTEIKYEHTFHGEAILTISDNKYSINANDEEMILTYHRHVYFQEPSEIDGVEIGDIITVSGIPNGYSLFYADIVNK